MWRRCIHNRPNTDADGTPTPIHPNPHLFFRCQGHGPAHDVTQQVTLWNVLYMHSECAHAHAHVLDT